MQNKIAFSIVCILLTLSLAGCSDKKPAIESNIEKDNVYERAYSPSIGPESAKVTIVEFFDPACEACRSFNPFVKDILSKHPKDVRLVLRYAAFHQGSETVIRMLETARLQNVFEPVLEALFEHQPQWASHHKPSIDRAWDIAEAAGLNVMSAKAFMNSTDINQLLEQEKADIRQLKVSQTPTFFVNEKPLTSFGPKQLYDLVLSELQK